MLSWVCVLLGLVALAAAQVNESLTADSSLEDRYEEAVEFRRRHFYCLDVNQSISDFPQGSESANQDEQNFNENLWAIFLQYPILSYLDSARKENLFFIIARLVQLGDINGPLADFNESEICVANVYHYGVSTFEESILINIYLRDEDDTSLLSTISIEDFHTAFSAGFAAQAANMNDNSLVQRYLGRDALAINTVMPTGGVTATELNRHPGVFEAEPNEDPTFRAVVLGYYPQMTTIENIRESRQPINFAQNPDPFNLGLEAGDIVFAVIGSIFLVIVGFLTILGFCIHPFFLA